MNSVWQETVELPHFKSLTKEIKTDVLIIGGGIAGILCAYMLHRLGIDYVLAEAGEICGGVTQNTTAKITSQHGLIYDKLIQSFGVNAARKYLMANQIAVAKYRELCADIDCDFEKKDAFVYSLSDREIIKKEASALRKIGIKADFTDQPALPFGVAGAIRFKNQAQFNPLKFISAISRGLNIYEHTPIRQMVEHTAIGDKCKIRAKKIIAATHFPFINKHGSYFLKMYQQRSYVIALENAQDLNGMYIDGSQHGLSFRNYQNLLLIGGGSHRTGKQGGNWKELEKFAHKYYPRAKLKCRWATQDCMTLDGMPYIGRYSKNTPDFYVATGFNKWGMTSSMVAARILTDMITGKQNNYAELFSPSRSIMHPQLAVNIFEATANLLSISEKRCPHMGCALKWNPCEHSWDCPCHGSRFTADGRLINNPADGDLKCLRK